MTEILTRFHYDEAQDRLVVQRTQDIEPILEENKLKANNADSNWTGEFHHVASIPCVIIEKVKNETGLDLMTCSREERNRFLNDPSNRFLRTKLGRL